MHLNRLTTSLSGLILFVFGIFFPCIPAQSRTVDNPWINFANTATLDISSVELTDTATVLSVKATYYPKYWIRVGTDTHLLADGKVYALTAADGIRPGEQFWMPESGKAEFKLFFQPLPLSTRKFDYIEGDDEGAYLLLDIDITGDKVAEYPEGIPDNLKKDVGNVVIPDPVFEMGKTTVNFHLCPYRPKLGLNLNAYVNTMGGEQQEYPLIFDKNGNATISFDQYGSAKAFVVGPGGKVLGSLTLYPGENIDCYLDTRLTASRAMSNNRDIPSGVYKISLHTGKFGDYDRAIADITKFGSYGGDEELDYRVTGEEYKKKVKERYNSMRETINNADIPQGEKDYNMLMLQNIILDAITNYRRSLERSYKSIKRNWSDPVPFDSVPARLSEKDFKEVVCWFDISNPKLLMVDVDRGFGDFDWNKYGTPGDLSKSINMFRNMAWKAKTQKLSETDLDSLRSLSNPFFEAACDTIANRTARTCLELNKKVSVMPTPDVPDEKVFDAIIAPYKGKVVVVDLWNTWCAPCRAAIRRNEPLKTGELSDEDIVWIYIADETSDPVKYLEMIVDIKGIHYKVNDNQIKTIKDRFEVDGIPFYILVDREGKAVRRPDLRNHSVYINAIKSKL